MEPVLEKEYIKLSSKIFNEKVAPTLEISKLVGNTYTASLYMCLISLLAHYSRENDSNNCKLI